MILSLLPSSLLKIMEVFGFTGDREYALATLMKGGKWAQGQKEPGMEPEKEGIRRQSRAFPLSLVGGVVDDIDDSV